MKRTNLLTSSLPTLSHLTSNCNYIPLISVNLTLQPKFKYIMTLPINAAAAAVLGRGPSLLSELNLGAANQWRSWLSKSDRMRFNTLPKLG